MWKYVARKILLAVPLVWCVVTLIFVLLELSPGDISDKFFTPDMPPELAEEIRRQYQLDQPGWVRYLAMMKNLALFDFGRSMANSKPVFELISHALPNTIVLSAVTLLVIYPTGIVLGTIQSVRHGSKTDTALSVGSLVLYAMPGFWLAMMLQLLVAFYWGGWLQDQARDGVITRSTASLLSLPTDGMVDLVRADFMSTGEQIVDRLKHLLLPGVAMGLASSGATARYMRSSMLEVIRQDFVRTARAKGLHERAVVVRHALRNALLPIVTLMGLNVPTLFSGAVLVETIFSWPGMGRLIVDAIKSQDTPLIIACFYVFTLLVVLGNLLADLAYAWVDPRIQFD